MARKAYLPPQMFPEAGPMPSVGSTPAAIFGFSVAEARIALALPGI
jgi:hypothetical protein